MRSCGVIFVCEKCVRFREEHCRAVKDHISSKPPVNAACYLCHIVFFRALVSFHRGNRLLFGSVFGSRRDRQRPGVGVFVFRLVSTIIEKLVAYCTVHQACRPVFVLLVGAFKSDVFGFSVRTWAQCFAPRRKLQVPSVRRLPHAGDLLRKPKKSNYNTSCF